MQKLNKLVALMLALVMMMSLSVTANAAYSDAGSITHSAEIGFLTELGILGGYPDGTFKPTNSVTRAELAKQIVAIELGPDYERLVNSYGSYTAKFTDTVGSWAEKYIGYCASQGYIKGYGDGTFRPDRNVTAAEAAAMLLRVLGYDKLGEYSGVNWNGGMSALRDARTAKLDKGLALIGSETINRDTASTMIYNALFAQTKTFSGLTYRDDGTLAENKYNISNATGTITRVESNAVYLDGVKFEGVTTDLLNLGLKGSISVEYNNKKTSSTRINKSNIKTVLSTEVSVEGSPLSSTYDGTSLSALTTKGNSKFVAQLDTKVTYYLNGIESTNSAVSNPSVGDILNLIDTDDNGKADIVSLYQYSVGEVKHITSKNLTIGSRTVSFDKAWGYEDLQNNDLVYFYVSNGHYFFYLAEVEDGSATSRSSNKYSINGTSHLLSSHVSSNDISLRKNYTFLYDSNGCIISVNYKTSNNYNYSEYLLGVSNNRYNNSTQLTSAKVIMENGRTTSITIASIGTGSDNYQIAANEIANNVYSYDIDDDGNYVLMPVSSNDGWYYFTGGEFYNGSRDTATTNHGTIYFDSSTRFIDVGNDRTYTGYQNIWKMSSVRGWYLLDDDSDTVNMVYIISSRNSSSSPSSSSTNNFYIFNDSYNMTATGTYYYMAYVEDALQAVLVNTTVHNLIQKNGVGLYTITSGSLDDIVNNATYASFESKWTNVVSDNGSTVKFGDGKTGYLNDDTNFAIIYLDTNAAVTLSGYDQATSLVQSSNLTNQMVIYTYGSGNEVDQLIIVSGFEFKHSASVSAAKAYAMESNILYGDGTKLPVTITVKATPYTTVVLKDSAGKSLESKFVPSSGTVTFSVDAEADTTSTYTLAYSFNTQTATDSVEFSYKTVFPITISGDMASKVTTTSSSVHKIGSKYYAEKATDATFKVSTSGTFDAYLGTTYFYDKGIMVDLTVANFSSTVEGLTVTKDEAKKTFEAEYVWTVPNVTEAKEITVSNIKQSYTIPTYTAQWWIEDDNSIQIALNSSDSWLTRGELLVLGLTAEDISVKVNGTALTGGSIASTANAADWTFGTDVPSNKAALTDANAGILVLEFAADTFSTSTDASKVELAINGIKVTSTSGSVYSA